MMKKVMLLLLLIVPLWMSGQSNNVRLNNFWGNTYYINPASMNEDYKGLFTIAARNQWLGFAGAPKTLFASGTLFVNRINTQFGLKFYADQIGYNTITNASLSYSYMVMLDNDWSIDLGLAGSFQSLSYDRSKVNTYTADDPALYENLLQSYNYNCDVGAELVNNEWKFGVSAQNLFSPFFKGNNLQDNINYAYATYRKDTKHIVSVQYGLCATQTRNVLQVESNLTTFFRLDEDRDAFQVSLLYRTRNEMGAILGMNLNSQFHISYSYDFNVSGIARYSTGSHELMLVYRMDKYKHRVYRYR